MAFSKPQLEDRINAIRAEINAFIDARVAEIGKTCPGVPAGVIRGTLFRGDCLCDCLLQLKAQDEAQARGAA